MYCIKKLLFIFNPFSGKAKLKTQLYEIVHFYTKNGYLVTVYPSQNLENEYCQIWEMAQSFDLIVCSGGDGTLNEIISSCLTAGIYRPIGYIPSGSANDFANSIGIPAKLENALEITLHGIPFRFDVGLFNKHPFVYVAAFGIFTNIPYTTPQKFKNSFGYLAYILEGIKAISDLRSYPICVKYNGQTIKGRYIMGLIINSYSVAGFRNPFHKYTELNDGLFELILVKSPKNITELQTIITALLNEDTSSEYLICVQSSCFQIESELLEWTLDGEYGGKFDYAEITILNQCMQILVSEDWFHTHNKRMISDS